MNNNFILSLKNLSAANDCIHIFHFDSKHRFLNCNTKQAETIKTLLEIKNKKTNFHLLPIHEVYAYDPVKADQLCTQNEEVLQTGITKTFKTTLIIPGRTKIKLLTTKFAAYDHYNKISSVFGIAYFLSEFSLQKALEYELTARETDCLEHLLNRDTSIMIADKLGISNRTVDDYIDSLKNKFDCETRQELISKAEKIGFLKKI